jgi:hypothetical protein
MATVAVAGPIRYVSAVVIVTPRERELQYPFVGTQAFLHTIHPLTLSSGP